ncbi:MAG TPA: GntR family transcriptional regulator [Thermodesulfobacteriota bacterium]
MVVNRTRLAHANLGEQVFRAVREAILGRAFAPGTRIRVEHFTESLGVSRTPVLDALRRLEAEGLVATVPRQGIYVVEFTRQRAEELYAVRGALEGLAARLAAARAGRGLVEAPARRRLAELLDEQAAAVRDRDYARFSKADIAFHNEVLALAGNETLTRSLDAVYGQILVLRLRTLNIAERAAPSVAEHRLVLEAIESGDAAAAETAARAHVDQVGEDAARLLAALDT